VRTATKRQAGSGTKHSDSAGRRLGIKRGEGSAVGIGDIILRQRGTKFWPGENANIGRDHTIISNESGYVRFYRDPFHPNRKLVGVALGPELRLPTPHWLPRVRRFGRLQVEDAHIKRQLIDWRPKKELMLQDEIAATKKARANDIEQRIAALTETFKATLDAETAAVAAERQVYEEVLLSRGLTVDEARADIDAEYAYQRRLEVAKGLITEQEALDK
ncbi:hypothetical protein CANCADRAFT_19163, partial [Tortispora caseinolytica NRRL Y-17796]